MRMLRRIHLIVLSAVIMVALVAKIAESDSTIESPDPFGKYLVFTAAGVYDESIPPAEGDLGEWFHFVVMGRSLATFEAEKAAADAYFSEKFGALYSPGSLQTFVMDPRNEYRAYFISDEKAPSEGWIVRDGGFLAFLTNGGLGAYGDYNIEVVGPGRSGLQTPIIIHYETPEPLIPMPDGSLPLRLHLRSNSFDDFGGGLAQGIFASKTINGLTVANVRNILTFPGLGFDAP
jgi:hypothetical protein